MTRLAVTEYAPDVASPPGETLLDLLDERGLSQSDLAERTARPLKTINEIINGKAAITPQTAVQLERVLGVPARFWLNREARYREHAARLEGNRSLDDQDGWLAELPIAEMLRLEWIERAATRREQVAVCLAFFGVNTVAAWRTVYAQRQASFRRSAAFAVNEGAVAAWLRQGEREAARLRCAPYDRTRFRALLDRLRALTIEREPPTFVPRLQDECAKAGVAVVFVPAPHGTGASGAARWLRSDRALIQLSLRYRTNDHLWFTFFHEAGHILLHNKRSGYLDGDGSEGAEEEAANRFAADVLIPPAAARRLTALAKSEAAVKTFAHEVGVAPGIVVGRMQHDGLLPYGSRLNRLKVSYTWWVVSGP
ncbi:MAG: helix-turn-helix domain-containing protein [Ardenticatenales bacterium]